MIFALLKTWLAPFLPSSVRSSNNNKAYKTPESGFVTIGGGSAGASSRNRQAPQSARRITTNMTLGNESEEHSVNGKDDVRLKNMYAAGGRQHLLNAIVVSKQVSIMTEDCSSEGSAESLQQV
jgi:hypothetical protein